MTLKIKPINTGSVINGLESLEPESQLQQLESAVSRISHDTTLAYSTRIFLVEVVQCSKESIHKIQVGNKESNSWIPVVSALCKAVAISDVIWKNTVRTQLLNIGVLPTKPAQRKMEDGRSIWHLDIDLRRYTCPGEINPIGEGVTATPLGPTGIKSGGKRTVVSIKTTNGPVDAGPLLAVDVLPSTITPSDGVMGDLLQDMLSAEDRDQVNRTAAGASLPQQALAAQEWRRQVQAGTVRKPAAYAMKLARLARDNAVVSRESAAGPMSPPPPTEDAWQRRAAFAGWHLVHPKHGRMKVEAGGQAWRHESGEQTGDIVVGPASLALWQRVETKELTLSPPET